MFYLSKLDTPLPFSMVNVTIHLCNCLQVFLTLHLLLAPTLLGDNFLFLNAPSLEDPLRGLREVSSYLGKFSFHCVSLYGHLAISFYSLLC